MPIKKNKINYHLKNIGFLFLLACFLVFTTNGTLAQSRSEVTVINGNPTLKIDGKIYPPFAYMSYLGEKKYYKEIETTGIHLYNIPSYLGEGGINTSSGIGSFRVPIWIGENQYDFSSIIKDFKEILRSDPKAKVIVRFYLDPPLWWEKQNPDASCQLPDGSTFRQCFASDVWRKKTATALKDCLKWLLKSEYANYLAGIHIAAGFTEEWFYHPKQYRDENPVQTDKFQKWLKKKYHNTASLQKSWNNSVVDFKNASLANINSPSRNEWRNPINEQNYIDTYKFRADIMAENIAYFCKVVKKVSNGNLLTGAFYGYHYYVTDARRGHGSLAKLLDCKYLDYISSPNVYNRAIGEDWPPMAAVQSVQMHGKLWLAENDTRTSITTLLKDRSQGIAPPGQYEKGVWLGPKDLETSVSLLLKNAARMFAYGYGGWWFDMWGGWFSDPALLNVLAKTQQLHSKYLPKNRKKMQSQVLVIVDEELSFWDASYGRLSEKILSNRYPLGKTGTSYDLFLRNDFKVIPINEYRVIWLMGLLKLSPQEKLSIDEWKKKGITVLWTNALGTTIYKKNDKSKYLEGKLKWSDSELRKLWRNSGVHVYNDTDDVTYIGNNWLGIHSVKGGKRTINFPFSAQVINPFENNILSDSTKTLNLKLPPKSTTLLRIIPL